MKTYPHAETIREEELISEIISISSLEVAEKFKTEFHSSHNSYCYSQYLNKMERVKNLLLKGFDDFRTIVTLIKTDSDYFIN